jgi:2-dehydro-3-deoxyphosphogluconate aldolase/(4S)-4-hydroxy-2-oxoglutarate aldolase
MDKAGMSEGGSEAAELRRRQLEAIIGAAPIIPVITIERAADAVPLARALLAGGLRTLEITLRTPAAPAAVAAIVREVAGAIVGVGTVVTPEDLAAARTFGARFALSPGATPELLDAAAAGTLPFIPGVQTASELMAALARGFSIVKFFPAAAAGIAALGALAGPFPTARFCPTGGIGEDTFASWLALPHVAAIGGSWLTPSTEVRAGDWEAIAARARRTLAKLRALAPDR